MILTVFHSESKADIAAHDVSESLRRIITTAKSEPPSIISTGTNSEPVQTIIACNHSESKL